VIKEDLKATGEHGVVETPKAYKLLHCFVVGKVQMQWEQIVHKMHCKYPWIGMNGQSHKGLCLRSWLSFQDCIKLHELTVFPADVAEKQRFCMQQMIKKPQQVTVHQ
jgi:hypothetical protein